MKTFLKQKNKGFTLVETLVAVTILVIGSLGPIAIAAQGIVSAGYAKDQIVAYYLAQEGLELVRNVRDSNAIQGKTDPDILSPDYWLFGLENCETSFSAIGCRIDAKNPTAVATKCSNDGSSCKNFTLDNKGYYGYTPGGTQTKYKRTINTTVSGNIVTVVVRMDWNSHNNPRSLTLSEDLYNSN